MNTAFDDEDWTYFDGDGENEIEQCFRAVLSQNVNASRFMPLEFKQWVINAVSETFEWPKNTAFGNAFHYLYEQYTDNVTTNLRTHCETRLKMFFYDDCI